LPFRSEMLIGLRESRPLIGFEWAEPTCGLGGSTEVWKWGRGCGRPSGYWSA